MTSFRRPRLVEVAEGRERCDFLRPLDDRGPKSPGVVHRYPERLHQRSAVLRKALLTRHEAITVVEIFHLALVQVIGEADIVVRREQQAGAFTLKPFANSGDFLRCASCSD